jgi:hypothetical protein
VLSPGSLDMESSTSIVKNLLSVIKIQNGGCIKDGVEYIVQKICHIEFFGHFDFKRFFSER